MEIWKDVLGYEGLYQVSSFGNVKSLDREIYNAGNKRFCKLKGYILKSRITTTGYYIVDLSKNSKLSTRKVHQLVAESFLNHISSGFKLVVNHKNRIKTDNNVYNLEIITQRENTSYNRLNSYSQYTGVSFHKHKNKWIASIKINNKSIHLGYFLNEIDAHEAYQKALSEL